MSESSNEKQIIVIDPGSGTFKLGEAGRFVPRVVFDSVVGKPKFPGLHPGMGPGDFYVGDEALTKRLVLDLDYCIDSGRFKSLENFDRLFSYGFSELQKTAEESYVLFSEAYQVPVAQRENLAEMIFEKHNVRGFFAAPEALLATYGSGKTTALVIDFGEHKTDIIPIYEAGTQSMLIDGNIPRCFFGGAEVTDELMKSLANSGYPFNTYAEREIVRDIKEKLCYVAFDFDKEQEVFEKEQKGKGIYTLPDGTKITVRQQRFYCPEAYFRPAIIGREDTLGVHQHIVNLLDTKKRLIENIMMLRQDFAQNILLTGGGSMIPGFAKRLVKELAPLGNTKWDAKVMAAEYRKFFTWYGGSLLAPMITFVSRDDFEEQGPQCVNAKV